MTDPFEELDPGIELDPSIEMDDSWELAPEADVDLPKEE